jgi:hypothetical protein
MATDCILDIRNYLLDCPETCDLTCYHLEHNGKPLNDYVEVSEYPALLAPAKAHHLTIVPGKSYMRTNLFISFVLRL